MLPPLQIHPRVRRTRAPSLNEGQLYKLGASHAYFPSLDEEAEASGVGMPGEMPQFREKAAKQKPEPKKEGEDETQRSSPKNYKGRPKLYKERAGSNTDLASHNDCHQKSEPRLHVSRQIALFGECAWCFLTNVDDE